MLLSNNLLITSIYFLNSTNYTMQNKPLASSEPEANSLGSILLKSTLQHRFSCSCKYNNITYSEVLVKKMA